MLRMQDGQPLEAVIMAGLAHPSIVHTIAHSVVRPRSPALARCPLPSVRAPTHAAARARAPRRRRLAGARAAGETGLCMGGASGRCTLPCQRRIRCRSTPPRAACGWSGCMPGAGPLHFTAASQLLAVGQSYPCLKAAHCVRPAQVPAKDIEAWDSAHEGAASEAARKAQTRRAASAKHGNAWLLLEFMDRGCLQARRPRAAARPPRPQAAPQAESQWSAQRPGGCL